MIDKLRHKTGFILNGFWLITAVVFSLVMCSKLVAQETRISPEDRELLISRIEEIAERSEEELDYTGLLEDMFYFSNTRSISTMHRLMR